MPKYYYGGKAGGSAQELVESKDLIVVRSLKGKSLSRSASGVLRAATAEVADGELVVSYPEADVEVYRVPVGSGKRSLASRKEALRAADSVRFAGGVLVDPMSRTPVLYTENLFVKFHDHVPEATCHAKLRTHDLTIKKPLDYAANAYFVAAPEGAGQEVFATALRLLDDEDVQFCHPELIRPRARRAVYPQQWHLKETMVGPQLVNAHANVEAAHALSQGEGVTIAVIDDGVDIDHPEFASQGKIVAPRDVTVGNANPRPKAAGDDHGTACAGVACADGLHGASGVAPKAKLMPIRLYSGLGSQQEADAFKWAADHGADVISCSWGPEDGEWWNPNDPTHNQQVGLPDSTKLAIDYAVSNGRGGKGCVVLFAAGNGNESVENDGYASYENVVAVAACNDRGKRSVYSDFGKSVWCSFPSNDFTQNPAPLTPGIWTTDRVGSLGYNPGNLQLGDLDGDFSNEFGGTSSACPGAAGVAALVLSVNPELTWKEVKTLLAKSCDRIDPQGGQYSSAGHSKLYGYGRLNAKSAVSLAIQPDDRESISSVRKRATPIDGAGGAELVVELRDTRPLVAIEVGVWVWHPSPQQLRVELVPPSEAGDPSLLPLFKPFAPAGSSRRVFTDASTTALAKLIGRPCAGHWRLRVRDADGPARGVLMSFSINVQFASSEAQPPVAPRASRKSAVTKARSKPKVGKKARPAKGKGS